MKAYESGNRLTIELEEKINSVNAAQIEAEICQMLAEHPGDQPDLDAEKLTYISSSGLRILIRLDNKYPQGITIRNVSPEVYEIFEVTGISTLMKVEKRKRRISVEGCEIIGEGAFGTVYRLDDDTVVKVYRDGENSLPIIEEEQRQSRQAFLSGIPTAIPFDIVRVGDQYGAVFEMINARNCNDLIVEDPAILPEIIPQYAAFLKKLHGKKAVPGQLEAARDLYLGYLDVFGDRLPEKTVNRLRELLRNMPEDDHLVHGDIQMKNVMKAGDEMILIDMDKICTGNPVFEFASLYASYILFNEDDPLNSMRFLGIDRDTSTRIYNETLRCYLNPPDGQIPAETERKIRILGYIRFLKILIVEIEKDKSELKEIRIRHAVEHLENLVFQAEDLVL